MNSEACLRLDALLRTEAARLGAPQLGDESILEDERREDGTRRPLPPRQRLIERIDALERHILLLDRRVYEDAMTKIRGLLQRDRVPAEAPGFIPEDAVVMIPSPTEEGEAAFPLSGLPDLSAPLARLRELRNRVLEDNDAGA